MGRAPLTDDYLCNLGDEIDEGGDPPRVFLPDEDVPGTAFSRSIGDYTAQTVGCIATPECTTTELVAEDCCMILASDGVWEFMTNQTVVEMAMSTDDPFVAANRIVARAAYEWVTREQRTDDITVVVIYLRGQCDEADVAPKAGEATASIGGKRVVASATASASASAPNGSPTVASRRGSTRKPGAAAPTTADSDSDSDSDGSADVGRPQPNGNRRASEVPMDAGDLDVPTKVKSPNTRRGSLKGGVLGIPTQGLSQPDHPDADAGASASSRSAPK